VPGDGDGIDPKLAAELLRIDRDLAEELATTLSLGRRDALNSVLAQRSDLGPRWRVGRAAVPPF